MISEIFMNPKIYNKEERKEKIKKISINNVIFKNNFNGYNYSCFEKKELFDKKNIPLLHKYIENINFPVYELLSYNLPTKFYLDCELENLPREYMNKKDEIIINFNKILKNFLIKKYQTGNIELLYSDATRLKSENNYKLSLHVVVNGLGYYKHRQNLKNVVLEFQKELPQDIYFRNGKSFVDECVYHNSQLMRIVFSPNTQKNSILKPFVIENDKIIYKNIDYISENFEKSLCGKYDDNDIFIDNEIYIEKEKEIHYRKNVVKTLFPNNISIDIPEWKISWIKNSNYIKNIYEIDVIENNKVNLKRILSNAYCKLCNRNHDKDNAFCIVYDNNIVFYCNRNKKGKSIGSWYNDNINNNNNNNKNINIKQDELILLRKENVELKNTINSLMNEIQILKKQKNIDNISTTNKLCGKNINHNILNKYYECGKLLYNNELNIFNNIITQYWKDSNVSKIKNRCLRIYSLFEYMKINNIENIKTSIRNIFHIPNWKFDEQLKNNHFF